MSQDFVRGLETAIKHINDAWTKNLNEQFSIRTSLKGVTHPDDIATYATKLKTTYAVAQSLEDLEYQLQKLADSKRDTVLPEEELVNTPTE